MTDDTVPLAHSDRDLVEIRSGDDIRAMRAGNQLARRYTPLVLAIVAPLTHGLNHRDDIVQAGFLGFVIALNKFDPMNGASIGTFARKFIHGAAAATARVQHEYELRTRLAVVSESDEFARYATQTPETQLLARIAETENAIRDDRIRNFVRVLPDRLRYVAIRVFWDGASQADVSRELNVSRTMVTKYVRSIQRRGLAALNTEPTKRAASTFRSRVAG